MLDIIHVVDMGKESQIKMPSEAEDTVEKKESS